MVAKALAIDGNSLLFRCYYATIKMLDYYHKNNLIPTNAIFLMISTIFKLLNNSYQYVFIAFDAHRKTFRNQIFPNYKMNRSKTPEDLIIQLGWIKKIISAMGIYHEARDNYEADDLIGSFVKKMNDNNISVDIYSSDRDLLQLITPLTNYHMFKVGLSKTTLYTNNNFSSLFYGLKPNQVVDFKAIVGDSSDNFTGIKGIGPKGAANLLQKYGSLNEIYRHINELSQKNQQILSDDENKKSCQICHQIAQIKDDLFLSQSIDKFVKKNINLEEFNKIIDHLKIPSFKKYILSSKNRS